MQVEFVGAPKNNIELKIKELFKQSNKISIAVAFLESSGVATIRQSIEEIKKKECSISILTGLDFGITNPEALEDMLNLDVDCRIFNGGNFHPKLYIFENNGGNATIIIGSSNLSKGGLSTNYEVNVILSGKIEDVPISDAIEYFSEIHSKSVSLDAKIIELYRIRKNRADEIKNIVNSDEITNKVTDELKDYLSQNVSSVELTESEYEELLHAEKKFNEGWDLYATGRMNHAYNLFKESYDIYEKFLNAYGLANNFLVGKINCLLGLGWVNYHLEKSVDVRECTDYAEKYADLLENKELLLEALGLGALARGITKDSNEKCDKFIEIYKSIKSNLEYNNYNLIGNVYSRSAECKFELRSKIRSKINVAYEHSHQAIHYLKKTDLSEFNYDTMISHGNIAKAYIVKNNIQPEPDRDNNIVINHFDKALIIARKEVKSEFWEAYAMLDLAVANTKGTIYVTISEACNYLQKAKKTFKKLEHSELVKEIDIYIKDLGCKS